ncbi:LamG-like jellyroll fold domain-containing protein [Mucisphaera sp.]|uniref:LamG-like jellyroll fold domain-containing protein n=1 Tax=Mucisphaera sp. TaxID=2913024 RepID=UPI003D14DE97
MTTRTTLLAASALALTTATANADLLLEWTFDETAGNAINTGTLGAAGDGVPGATAARIANTPSGSGLAADLTAAGAGSIFSAGDLDVIDGLNTFTLSTWINIQDLNSAQGGSGNVRLISEQGGGSFPGPSWNLNNPNTGTRAADNVRTALFVGGDNGFAAGFQTDLDINALDQWVFLAVAVDLSVATDNMTFYLGSTTSPLAVAGVATTGAIGPVQSDGGAATEFGIGFTSAAPTADTSLNGYQDNVRVWDEALSTAALTDVFVRDGGFVPEPASAALLGLAAVAMLRRR